ncbi:acetate kinase [Helicobacter pylori]|uniref:acetate kinase n=1 Tax=Helicobacter pylori TaxID=210 RepID=UPI00215A061B|nr:acetate kinase [Helicobacter pylori]
MQGLWIYPEDTEVLGAACKSLAQCANKSLEEVMKMLNHESGLKGICGDNEKHRSQKRKRR